MSHKIIIARLVADNANGTNINYILNTLAFWGNIALLISSILNLYTLINSKHSNSRKNRPIFAAIVLSLIIGISLISLYWLLMYIDKNIILSKYLPNLFFNIGTIYANLSRFFDWHKLIFFLDIICFLLFLIAFILIFINIENLI